MHSKVLIVDGKYTIVTGANIEKIHKFTDAKWHDTGYLLEGPVAQTVLNDFDEAWEAHAIHWDCKERPFMPDCLEVKKPPRPARDYISQFKYDSGFSVVALPRQADGSINNNINNPQDQGWLIAMSNAQSFINIETPNINDDTFQNAVIEAIKRGITINLMTSKGFNDTTEKYLAQGGTNEEIAKKLQTRVAKEVPAMKEKLKIKWYSKDGKNPIIGGAANASHTKFMSIDSNIAIVGSGNMDTQTWNHSREFNILIDSPEITKIIDNDFFNGDWERGIIFQ